MEYSQVGGKVPYEAFLMKPIFYSFYVEKLLTSIIIGSLQSDPTTYFQNIPEY